MARLKLHDDVPAPADDDRRRTVLREVIAAATEEDIHPSELRSSGQPLVRRQDLPLLLAYLDSGSSGVFQAFVAKLIGYVADLDDSATLDVVLVACKANGFLREEFASLLTPVELGSERARQMQEEYGVLASVRRSAPKKREGPSPARLLKRHLREGKNGDLEAWWKINWALLFNEDGSSCQSEVVADLTKLPGWENADEQIRSDIIDLVLM